MLVVVAMEEPAQTELPPREGCHRLAPWLRSNLMWRIPSFNFPPVTLSHNEQQTFFQSLRLYIP